MKKISLFSIIVACVIATNAQSPEEIIEKVKSRLEKVKDYEAEGKIKTNVVFIKAPVSEVKIYYKSPNKLRIDNTSGISFIPKGTVNINLNNIFTNSSDFDLIDVGKENGSGLRIIKMLPKDEGADIVLSTLYIDEKNFLVKKAKTTTKENGTYELEMTYGRYIHFGLADKIIFSFNTKEYKLPRGVTFDYDDGSGKKTKDDKTLNKKGKVEITYSSYTINKGVPDSVFN